MQARITHYLGHQTLLVAQIVFLFFFFQLFIFDVGRVDGTSMEPTYMDNQVFLTNRYLYFFREPRRYEIIQFFHPLDDDRLVIKRVIGLPGELVEIRPGAIRITKPTGQQETIDEFYLARDVYTEIKPGWYDRFVVPENAYVVLGDNRPSSVDSREYGLVHRRRIIGEVSKVTWSELKHAFF